jgi:pSer/pThr/pTyr-binding forkhead associated (FHA) protein
MPYLIQKNANGTVVRQWDVTMKPLSLGRGEQANIQIDDEELSRVHFTILPEGDGFAIQDEKSTNGTYVNGKRITRVTLKPNDRIRAGQTLFSFVDGLSTVIRKLEKEDRHYSTFVKKLTDKDKK